LDFEPLFPADRRGSDPDGLAEVMRQVGFDLRADEDRSYELHTEAAFALADHLTGVRLTPEFLDSATFLCGMAPPPGIGGPTRWRILEALDGVGDLRVDTDNRPADDIAARILGRTGWPAPPR